MATDINRGTTGVVLPMEVSSEIWAKTLESSAVMQLARRIELPGAGMEFQTVTGEPEAAWVDETAEKPVATHTFDSKKMKGYTLAVIEPFSNQFRRDKEALYSALLDRLPYAIGKKFDETVFGIAGSAPGENFDTMAGCATVDVETDPWAGLVSADAAIAAADGILNGWAIAPQFKSILLNAKDQMGRPLFIGSYANDSGVPSIMGHPTYVKKGVYSATSPAQLGFAGDWSSAIYGVVEDVKIDVSDQASLTVGGEQVNLWQRNMFAVRAEFEVGFRMKDEAHFVKLVGA